MVPILKPPLRCKYYRKLQFNIRYSLIIPEIFDYISFVPFERATFSIPAWQTTMQTPNRPTNICSQSKTKIKKLN